MLACDHELQKFLELAQTCGASPFVGFCLLHTNLNAMRVGLSTYSECVESNAYARSARSARYLDRLPLALCSHTIEHATLVYSMRSQGASDAHMSSTMHRGIWPSGNKCMMQLSVCLDRPEALVYQTSEHQTEMWTKVTASGEIDFGGVVNYFKTELSQVLRVSSWFLWLCNAGTHLG